MASSEITLEKPRLRGYLHQYAFFVSLVAGALLVYRAQAGTAALTAGVFALSVAMLFGVSALYHRIQWEPNARRWMRKLDHCSIYLLISGTYTPVMAMTLTPEKTKLILTIVWGVSAVGMAVELFFKRVPKALLALTYIALGWVAVVVVPDLTAALGLLPMGLLGLGGILYTAGGVIYALKAPNPWPAAFGYHEIFHLLVIFGAALHYAVVAFYLSGN